MPSPPPLLGGRGQGWGALAIAAHTIYKNTENPVSSLETGFFSSYPSIYPQKPPWQLPNREQCALGSRKTKWHAKSPKTAKNSLLGTARALCRGTGAKPAFSLADIDVVQLILLSFFRVCWRWNFASMIASSVRLSEVLRQMEEGEERFSIRFVKADKRRKTGGQIIEWHNCQLSKRRVQRARRPAVAADVPETPGRAPDHYRNATRNIVQGNSSQPRKVHIWLLLEFNGQRVMIGS